MHHRHLMQVLLWVCQDSTNPALISYRLHSAMFQKYLAYSAILLSIFSKFCSFSLQFLSILFDYQMDLY